MTVRHNSHSGFQMQSWRGRKTRPSRAEAGRVGLNRQVLITGKYSSQGLGKSYNYVYIPPAGCRGRMRQSRGNNSRKAENRNTLHIPT